MSITAPDAPPLATAPLPVPVPAPTGSSTVASLADAFLVAISRPWWWALALGAFLVRGGWLMVLLPIVMLPTTAGLANAFGPLLVGFVFGGPTPTFLVFVGSVAIAVVAWFVIGGLLGGWLELGLARGAAEDEELDGVSAPAIHGDAWLAFGVRAIAHLPTAAVVAIAALPVVSATYEELIHPGDAALAVPLRVALRLPVAVAALGIAWLLGETVGGLAVRHLAWGAGLGRSLALAVRSLGRLSAVATLVATSLAVALVALGSMGAVGIAWDHLRIVLASGRAVDVRIALVVFSLTW